MPLSLSRLGGQNVPIGTSPSTGYTVGDGSTATFYFGGLTNPGLAPSSIVPTSANAIYPEVTANGTIRSVYLTIISGVPGSTEAGSGYIRINNGTDYLFNSSLRWDAVTLNYGFTGLAIPLQEGDFWSVKIVPPTFVTNPAVTYYFGQVAVTQP